MPTDQERRDFPDLSEEDWAKVEELRRLKAKGDFPSGISGDPSFEDQVLELLREQVELLRHIRDRLPPY